jgi:hypothetical protein
MGQSFAKPEAKQAKPDAKQAKPAGQVAEAKQAKTRISIPKDSFEESVVYLTYTAEDALRETLLERWTAAFPKPYGLIIEIPANIKVQSSSGAVSVKKRLEEIMRVSSDQKRSQSSAFQLLFKRIYIVRHPRTLSLLLIYEEAHRMPHKKDTVYFQTEYPLQDGFTTQYLSKNEWQQSSIQKESKESVMDTEKTVWLNKRILLEIKQRYKGKTRHS